MDLFFKVSDRKIQVDPSTPVAVFVDKNAASHVGLIFWSEEMHPHEKRPDESFHTRELHLLNDQFLKTYGVDQDNFKGQRLIAVLGGPPDDQFNRVGALAAQLDHIANNKGRGIALGPAWRSDAQYFDDDGTWVSESGMVTCATFVREALAAFGFDVIKKETWPSGLAENIAWKNGYIDQYQKSDKLADDRKAMLIACVEAVNDAEVQRLLPAEMAYSGALGQDDWPAQHHDAEPGGAKLIEQYKAAFAP